MKRTEKLSIRNRESAPAFWLAGTLWLILADGQQNNNKLTLIEQYMGEGLGPTTHRHSETCEGFYILEGDFTFNALGEHIKAGPGTFVYIPRGLPHSFSVNSTEARALNFYLPSRFEMLVMSLGKPAPELRRPTFEESAPPHTPEQIQILSELYGQEQVTALPFLVPPSPELLVTRSDDQGFGNLIIRNAADRSDDHDARFVLAATGETENLFELYELEVSSEVEFHVKNDNFIYVLEGAISVNSSESSYTAVAGTGVYLPVSLGISWRSNESRTRILQFIIH